MKKAEKVLVVLALMGIIMQLLHLPFAAVILSLSLNALAMLYFIFSFALLNDVKLSEVAQKGKLQEIGTKRIVGAVIVGLSLPVLVIGILFTLMWWPFGGQLLMMGLIQIGVISVFAFVRSLGKKSKFYTNVFIRIFFIGGIALALFLIPFETRVNFYFTDNDYKELLIKAHNDPSNVEIQEELFDFERLRHDHNPEAIPDPSSDELVE